MLKSRKELVAALEIEREQKVGAALEAVEEVIVQARTTERNRWPLFVHAASPVAVSFAGFFPNASACVGLLASGF